MGSNVCCTGGDRASKPLTEFMMSNRVDVPADATAPGRPGDWAVGDDKLFLCLADNDWFALALASVGTNVNANAPLLIDDGAEVEPNADVPAEDGESAVDVAADESEATA